MLHRAIPALLLGLAALPAPGQTCSDDFSGPYPGPTPWTFLDVDNADGGSHAITGGKLELTGRGADIFKEKNEYVALYRTDIKGDFDVSVKIESMQNTHNWAQAGIVAANDLKDLTKGGYIAADAGYATGYHLFYDAAAPQGQLDKHVGTGTTKFPLWLRLARRGTDFSAWYRTSATGAWTPIDENVKTLGGAAGVNSQIGIFSTSHNVGTAAKVVFDDFACLHNPVRLAPPRPLRAPSAGPALTVDAAGRLRAAAARSPLPVFPSP